MLPEKGRLYDANKGEALPEGKRPMPLLTEEDLMGLPETAAREVIPNHVARYREPVAMADRGPVPVIGAAALLRDRPGFEVGLLTWASATTDRQRHDRPSVVPMPVKGHRRMLRDSGGTALAPGATTRVPENLDPTAYPAMSGRAARYRVVATGDPVGPRCTEA